MRCEWVEHKIQRHMLSQNMVQEDRDVLLGFLVDVRENHSSAIHSSGIDLGRCSDMASLRNQVSVGSPGLS